MLAFVLLVLESGAQWESAPSRMTLWRRLRAWKADGIWHRVVGVLRAMPAYDGFEFDRVRTTVR